MNRTRNTWADHYTHRARKEHYAARSVYKLAEIQKKHRIIGKGQAVLDLGCAPGSWLQFAAQQTGSGGRVVGVDLQPVAVSLPSYVQVIRADIFAVGTQAAQMLGGPFDVVLSDMAPATTGDRFGDAARSHELSLAALGVADAVLRAGGRFVCKIFQGEDFKAFSERVRERFDRMHIFKPQSSRKASREIFVIGLGAKAGGQDVRS